MSTVSSLSSASISSAIKTDQARLQKPVTALQTEATADQAQISAWGTIKGSVSSLSSALGGISNLSTATALKATSSNTATATATAAASAVAGTYNLTHIQLAKTQEIYSAVKTSASANLGSGATGSLNFTLSNGKAEQVQIPTANQTLTGIAAAINAKAGGVQAIVIGTSSGARLVLQSSAPGSGNGFTFTGTGGLATLNYAGASGGGSFSLAQGAKNASFDINGVPVTNAGNTITSAVSGLTITLAASGSTNVAVASSAGGISGALSSVASNLSAAIAAIGKQTAFVPAASATLTSSATAAKSGPLLGNFTATDLSYQLLGAVSGAAASGMSANAIGFSVSAQGAVTFNAANFNTAYAANPKAVTALIGKIYAGLNTLTSAALGSATGSGTSTKSTGEIAAQTNSLQNEITSLNTQATQIERDNSAALNILVQQYTAAETASNAAQISQSYLSVFTNTSSGTSSG
ncbi:MAG: flagellar filament capping protein FliD [Acidocella sp.]|nr:flagellar filament capping protein FliD [Acidocella sp.]